MANKRQNSLCRAYIGRDGLDEFFGHITDIPARKEILEKGEWPDVETALAWARERADQIVLTYGGDDESVFSAGPTYYAGTGEKPLQTWPPDKAIQEAIDEKIQHEREHPLPPPPGSLGVSKVMIVRSDKEDKK